MKRFYMRRSTVIGDRCPMNYRGPGNDAVGSDREVNEHRFSATLLARPGLLYRSLIEDRASRTASRTRRVLKRRTIY